MLVARNKNVFFINLLNLSMLGKDFVCNKMTLLFYDGASDFFCRDCCFTTMPAIFWGDCCFTTVPAFCFFWELLFYDGASPFFSFFDAKQRISLLGTRAENEFTE